MIQFRNQLLATVALLPFAQPALADTGGFEILAPHRAAYDLKLTDASERSGIAGMTGRIVYEITGNECEGMAIRYRFVTQITTGEEVYRTDQQTATYESPDGKEFTFLTKSFVDDRPESTVRGVATRTSLGVDVDLTQPAERSVELPPAKFMSHHLVSIIESARKGERIVNSDIFDGSEDGDEVVASSTVIGEGRAAAEPFEGEDNNAISTLADEKACSIINSDPLGWGWLFVVEMNEPGEMEELLSPEQYDSYLESG